VDLVVPSAHLRAQVLGEMVSAAAQVAMEIVQHQP
jgi:hypothetical protein